MHPPMTHGTGPRGMLFRGLCLVRAARAHSLGAGPCITVQDRLATGAGAVAAPGAGAAPAAGAAPSSQDIFLRNKEMLKQWKQQLVQEQLHGVHSGGRGAAMAPSPGGGGAGATHGLLPLPQLQHLRQQQHPSGVHEVGGQAHAKQYVLVQSQGGAHGVSHTMDDHGHMCPLTNVRPPQYRGR